MPNQKTDCVALHESSTPNAADVLSIPISSAHEDHLVDVPIYTTASATISSFPYKPSDAFCQSSPFVSSPSSCFPFPVTLVPHILDSLSTSAIYAIDPCIYSLLTFLIYFFHIFTGYFNDVQNPYIYIHTHIYIYIYRLSSCSKWSSLTKHFQFPFIWCSHSMVQLSYLCL